MSVRTVASIACMTLTAAVAAPPAAAAPMNFSTIDTTEEKFAQIVLRGGEVRIFATGEIKEGTADEFKRFVRQRGILNAKVHFNSQGGSLIGGLRLGAAIRDLGFDTEVQAKEWEYGYPPSALCASACAYAFAGGMNRFYSDSAGRLGLHQFYLTDGSVADLGQAQSISGVLVAYLQRMGVNPTAFALASMTKSSEMLWLSAKEAEAVGLANNGTQPTTAEIKIVDGRSYLRLEQEHHNVTARVLLTCVPDGVSVLAGIVTNPIVTAEHDGWQHRSYYELDGSERFVVRGGGTQAKDSVLWIDRDISNSDAQQLLRTATLGIWVENGGPMRWGAMMDLKAVHDRINYYLENCR